MNPAKFKAMFITLFMVTYIFSFFNNEHVLPIE